MKRIVALGCVTVLTACATGTPVPSSSKTADWSLTVPTPEASIAKAEKPPRSPANVAKPATQTNYAALPELVLRLPVDCQLGSSCWIAQYPDVNSGTQRPPQDYTCGTRTYRKHTGTDFAVADLQALQRGVAVLAPADGVVVAIRDGETDDVFRDQGKAALQGKSCGNGVRLRHAGEWGTQFCHLRKGSVRVRPGQAVRAGATLGLIGMSGFSEFPHVHMRFMKGLVTVDPFTGDTLGQGCTHGKGVSYWEPKVQKQAYVPVSVYALGFTNKKIKPDAIWADVSMSKHQPTRTSPLVGWMAAYGLQKGMRLRMDVSAPDGQIVHVLERKIQRDRNWGYNAVGRLPPKSGWPTGTYAVRVIISDGGKVIARRKATMLMK